MAVVLTIDGKTMRCDGEIVAIGRSPSNQISLPDDQRLAPVQAVLRLVSGRWIIEARDGGPIRVGSGRPAQFAWLNSQDVIHLTEQGPQVTFALETAERPPAPAGVPAPVPAQVAFMVPTHERLIAAANPGFKTPPPIEPAMPKAAGERQTGTVIPPWAVFGGAGSLVAVLLIGVGVLLGGGRTTGKPVPLQEAADRAVVPVPSASSPKAQQVKAKPVATFDPRNAIYRLELRTADRSKGMQLGTAWAISAQQLVTTGDAARGIASNQEFYPIALVRHSLSGKEFEIKDLSLHPQYVAANDVLEDTAREINRLLAELDNAQEPEVRKELEAAVRKLDGEAIAALDTAVNVNVATLEVAEDLAVPLSCEKSAAVKIGQQVRLMGHPISRTDSLVDPDHPTPLQEYFGRLQHADPVKIPAVPSRHLVRFSDPLSGQNWCGSPVLDSEGRVIGLYVRPTMPPPGAPPAPFPTHDIAVIDGLRDWLPKNPQSAAHQAK